MKYIMKHVVVSVLAMIMVLGMYSSAMAEEATEENSAEVQGATTTERLKNETNRNIREVIKKPRVKVTGRGDVKVILYKIKSISGVNGYTLYRSRKLRGEYSAVKSFENKKNIYVDRIVRLNKTYYYKIKPYYIKKGKKKYNVASEASKIKNRLKFKRSFIVKAYAYTGHATTASGKSAGVGRIAVDPRVIPLGTWLWIKGYGLAQACDTGGAIKGRTVDLFMNSESACRRWGIRYPRVYILKK